MEGRTDRLQHVDRGRRPRRDDRAGRDDDRLHRHPGPPPVRAQGADLEAAIADWRTLRTDDPSAFDRHVVIDADRIEPQVTWGTNPAMTVDVTGRVPEPDQVPFSQRRGCPPGLAYMGLTPGTPITEIPVDVVFIGSCTNGRIEDLRTAARVFQGRKVAATVRALVVPGSEQVRDQAEAEGLDRVFDGRRGRVAASRVQHVPGMNPDKLTPQQRSASTSNRNFEGRQGPGGRTHLVSPAMAAAAAVAGHFVDVRPLLAEAASINGNLRRTRCKPLPPTGAGRCARPGRRQHRPDHPGPLPQAGRAGRLRPAPLRRPALRRRGLTPKPTTPSVHGAARPRLPAQRSRSLGKGRRSSSSGRTSAAGRAASTPSGPSPRLGFVR